MENQKIENNDREVLIAIYRYASRMGTTLTDLADYTGFSVQRIAAVGRKYDGRRFKGFTLHYTGRQAGSMAKDAPGIKNPRTGICESIPAEIAVIRHRRHK